MTGETLVSAWRNAQAQLRAAGVDEPAVDARMLVEAGAGVARADILADPQRSLSLEQMQRIAALTLRRAAREPVSQILGWRGFRGITLNVSRDVLTPRPETELLVELGLQNANLEAPLRVLDLGVGSGALLAAFLSEHPNATGLGVDKSEAALAIARQNLEALGLGGRAALSLSDWADGVTETFDLIFANPPYISSAEFEMLAPEVRLYEPRLALFGGEDGLDAYRAILPALPRLLRANGRAILEIGPAQAGGVHALADQAGLRAVSLHYDLARRPRAWVLEKALGVLEQSS